MDEQPAKVTENKSMAKNSLTESDVKNLSSPIDCRTSNYTSSDSSTNATYGQEQSANTEFSDPVSDKVRLLWQQLSAEIQPWLLADDRQQPLKLVCLEEKMSVQYTGEQSQGNHLLRLISANEGKTPAFLQEKLPITKRESEVLYWVSFGKTNWEIGQILSMSPRTVNKHLEQLFKKIGVDNRTAAAAISIRLLENGYV